MAYGIFLQADTEEKWSYVKREIQFNLKTISYYRFKLYLRDFY